MLGPAMLKTHNRVPSVRIRLKHATQALHHSVERSLDLDNHDWTIGEYCAYLERMWGLFAPLERALMTIEWQAIGIEIAERRKLAWLESDLTQLSANGGVLPALEMCDDLPRLNCVEEGVGALYVIEGSTLGGRVVMRKLQRVLGISPDAGGRFFTGYGENTGAQWRSYLEVLESFGGVTEAETTIERSAVETFGAFDRWLSGFWSRRVSNSTHRHV